MRLIGVAAAGMLMLTSPLFVSADEIVSARHHADTLFSADHAFGAASAKLEGLAGLKAAFADDVIVPVPGKDFANGKQEVLAALRKNAKIDTAHIEWAPVRVGISADGNQGFSFGFMDQHQADGTTLPYKYLSYWQRQGKAWKIVAWKRGKRLDGEVERIPMPPLLPATVATQGDKAQLDAAEQAFSDEAQTIGLGPAFAKFGTVDSMNLGGAGHVGIVFGAQAIARLVSDGQAEEGSTVSWSADRVIVAASGDLGVSIGHIRFNKPGDDGSERAPIPFFTVWRRAAPDQPWRYVAE
ncbi:MAG: nuclear transport factor 2 family protein [Xanthomonadales bacterium]|nr:nuclear transport factor 2 family protein [Xanthomonadales bacterium]